MCPNNKIRSYDYLISNGIQIDQMSLNFLKDLNVEHLEYTNHILFKKLHLSCDAIHNLDSWMILWDRFVLDGDIK